MGYGPFHGGLHRAVVPWAALAWDVRYTLETDTELAFHPRRALAEPSPDFIVRHAFIPLVGCKGEHRFTVAYLLRGGGFPQFTPDASKVGAITEAVEDSQPDLNKVGEIAKAIPPCQPCDIVDRQRHTVSARQVQQCCGAD
jgi:hypothetical protein